MDDIEIWKPVTGYERWYEVSNIGRVRSFKSSNTGRILKFGFIGGYPYVNLCSGKLQRTRAVHQLVAGEFLSKPSPKHQVNHKNYIKTDNRVCNLEWVTVQENMRHRNAALSPRELGLLSSKLTEEQVIEIRRLYNNGRIKQSELANKFGVHQVTISTVITRKTWKHI